MDETGFQIARGLGFAGAATLALLLERLRPHAAARPSWRTNGGLWATNLVVMGVACGACACAAARWSVDAGVGLLSRVAAPLWVAIPATVLALDLVSYTWHRANHRIAFLWRFHRVHHSDPSFSAATGVRFHPGELVLSLPLRLAAVAVLGPPVAGVAAFEVVFTLANLLEHGNIDLPARLERRLGLLLVTPALHRRHHARRRPDLDRNFGTILAVWDRLAGTYLASSSALRIDTGLPETVGRPSLLDALRMPLASSPSPRISPA